MLSCRYRKVKRNLPTEKEKVINQSINQTIKEALYRIWKYRKTKREIERGRETERQRDRETQRHRER